MKAPKSIIFLLSVIVFSCGLGFDSVEYNAQTFNHLAQDILIYEKVNAMDDFSRYYKSLNGIPIRIDGSEGDSSAESRADVEARFSLSHDSVENLRHQLQNTRLREFYRSRDTILFYVDGFLDSGWGFLYSASPLQSDTTWFNFHNHSVKYVGDINTNWKRVSIR